MRSYMRMSQDEHLDLDSQPSPTAAKALVILDLLSKAPEGISGAEAVRQSGITGNLVFRILKTFVSMGFASQREEDKHYVLSSRLLGLSQPRVRDRSLVLCALDAMKSLRDDLGETVQLHIEAEARTLVLEQVQGTHALQVCGQVGMRIPLYSCAPGKAILTWWSDAKRSTYLAGKRLKSFTPHTLSTHAALLADLEASRRRGYTIDRSEGSEGIHCVAAPILDEYGNLVGAITTMAPSARMPVSEFPNVGQRCIVAAREIEQQLKL
jgi:DNA-binding IclR family transcriptional regulator